MVRPNPAPEIVGEQEHPRYSFDSTGEFQPTLDAFRSLNLFGDIIPELEEETGTTIDSALMYGSNVRGLSAFPDCEKYDFGSDIDLFITVRTDDLEQDRARIGSFLSGTDTVPVINASVQDADEFGPELENISEMGSEELLEYELPMDYAYYGQIGALPRLRAFGEGYILHPDYRGDVAEALESALDYISEDSFVKEELSDRYLDGSRDRSEKFETMRI